MQKLRDLARKLLSDGSVQVVLGYEQGPRGVRPAFISRPEDSEKLIFDPRCVHNLAAYLSPRRLHLLPLGRRAVVVKGCDTRAIAGLIREHQLRREDLVLIGVRCSGVFKDAESAAQMNAETLSPRCAGCQLTEPKLVDHLVGEAKPLPQTSDERTRQIEKLEGLSAHERWTYWQSELSRCIRCHACRQVCPLCYCEQCVADKTQPAWIESSPHPRGNLAWQLTRVLHHAGRCVDCGECERACPEKIPLGLLTKKAAQIVESRFGYRPSDDPTAAAPIGSYRMDDPQEFIV